MAIFLISLLVTCLVVAGMAVGVLMGRKPLKGSCGGLGAAGIDQSCELCGGDPKRCDEENERSTPAASDTPFYAADK